MASRGLARYPPSIPAATRAEIIPVHPVALPGVGAALTICCMCPVLMSWQIDRADDRVGEPLAQPPLGVRVLAGPPPLAGSRSGYR